MNTRKIVTFATSLLLLNLLAACAASTPQPPGVITGQVMYEALTNDGSAEPMPDVMVALCQVPAKGLPEGPIVASSNRDETEQVCINLLLVVKCDFDPVCFKNSVGIRCDNSGGMNYDTGTLAIIRCLFNVADCDNSSGFGINSNTCWSGGKNIIILCCDFNDGRLRQN